MSFEWNLVDSKYQTPQNCKLELSTPALLKRGPNLGWVYIRIHVQNTWVQNTPQCILLLDSKLEPSLKFGLSNINQDEYFLELEVGTNKLWWENQVKFNPTSFSLTLLLDLA
jgi:hypothetical protein